MNRLVITENKICKRNGGSLKMRVVHINSVRESEIRCAKSDNKISGVLWYTGMDGVFYFTVDNLSLGNLSEYETVVASVQKSIIRRVPQN